jgi:hypothetical protein
MCSTTSPPINNDSKIELAPLSHEPTNNNILENHDYNDVKELNQTSKVSFETSSSLSYKDPLRHYHPSTAVIMAGYVRELSEEAIKAPLFRLSTFAFKTAQQGELFFQRAYHLPGDDHCKPGLVYSCLNNPNTGTNLLYHKL